MVVKGAQGNAVTVSVSYQQHLTALCQDILIAVCDRAHTLCSNLFKLR